MKGSENDRERNMREWVTGESAKYLNVGFKYFMSLYHIIRTVATFTVSICPGVMSCGTSIE